MYAWYDSQREGDRQGTVGNEPVNILLKKFLYNLMFRPLNLLMKFFLETINVKNRESKDAHNLNFVQI